MLEKVFGVAEQAETISLGTTLSYMLAAVVVGILIAAVYILITEKSRRSLSFIVSMLILPAVVICLIVLSLNLLGDGLRDAFDPKLNA